MEKKNKISLLNKIKNKPLIINKIYTYSLSRAYILFHIISNELLLKKRLNNIFSKVSKTKNKLEKEFNNNLIFYSLIPKIFDELSKIYNKKKSNYFSYDSIKKDLHFSVIQYLFDYLVKYINSQKIDCNYSNKEIVKGIIYDFYSLSDFAIITMFQKNKNYLDNGYIDFVMNANIKSKEKNRIRQKLKLLLLFDEKKIYNKNIKEISLGNVNEIELIFGDDNINKMNLLKYFNNYLSNIEYIENINTIIFHNIIYENYISGKINVKAKSEVYQSLLSFLFDGYYLEKNENIKSQLKLLRNIHEIKIENSSGLYIYEKLKLYYCINELFPSIYIAAKTIKKDIRIYIINNMMIINIREKNLSLNEYSEMINLYLNNNSKIEYLFIFNHNLLIKEEGNKINEGIIKLEKSSLKEFMFICENSDNDNDLLYNSFDLKNQNKNLNVYKGYDINNKLIFYREGETHMQSFDLIDLFKYNKILVKIELIKEKIIIKYNQERIHLEILNIEEAKKNLNLLLNRNNYLSIKHFTQFIFNQNNLIELTINKFDLSFRDIINTNVIILNINYENNLSNMKYILNADTSDNDINDFFPNLIKLNIGGNCFELFKFQIQNFPKKLKSLHVLSKFVKKNKVSKLKKKFQTNGKEFIYENIEGNEEIFEDDDNEEEEEEDEEEINYYEKIYNKFDKNIFRTDIIMKDPYYKKSSDKVPNRKYLDRLYYADNIQDIKKRQEYKRNEEKYKYPDFLEYSKILKEYKDESKISKKLYFMNMIFLHKRVKSIYRASEKKYMLEDFISLGAEIQAEGSRYILIVKMKDGLYLYCEKYYYRYYFFSNDSFFGVHPKDIIFNEDLCKAEIKNVFSIQNSYSNGKLLIDIILKDKIIPRQTTVFVLDLEFFEIIEN